MMHSRVTNALRSAALPLVRVPYKVDLLIAGALLLGLMAYEAFEGELRAGIQVDRSRRGSDRAEDGSVKEVRVKEEIVRFWARAADEVASWPSWPWWKRGTKAPESELPPLVEPPLPASTRRSVVEHAPKLGRYRHVAGDSVDVYGITVDMTSLVTMVHCRTMKGAPFMIPLTGWYDGKLDGNSGARPRFEWLHDLPIGDA